MDGNPNRGNQNYYSILENEVLDFPPKKRPKNGKNKLKINSYSEFPKLSNNIDFSAFNQSNCPKFVVLKNKNEKLPLKSINIFALDKAIKSICANYLDISFTREGHVLILTKNELQANKFLQTTSLSNMCEIQAELHNTLNNSKGVIYAPLIINLTIVENMKSQGVIECKRIKKYIDGILKNTLLLILTFNAYNIPKEVNIGFTKCTVDHYIPTPLQCKNCFKFGHLANNCKNVKKCNICSANFHQLDQCNEVKCVNCNSQHRATNKNCPVMIKNKKINELRIINKWSYKKAVQEINTTYQPNIQTNTIIENLDEAKQIVQKKLTVTTQFNNSIINTNKEQNTKTINITKQHNTNNIIHANNTKHNNMNNNTTNELSNTNYNKTIDNIKSSNNTAEIDHSTVSSVDDTFTDTSKNN